jgi:hypothetical protein
MVDSYTVAAAQAKIFNKLKETFAESYFAGRLTRDGYFRLIKLCNERIVECLPILLRERNEQ